MMMITRRFFVGMSSNFEVLGDGVFLDPTGKVQNVVSWLTDHLEHPWGSSSWLVGDVLASAATKFSALDAKVKAKLVLSFLTLKPKSYAEIKQAAEAIVAAAETDAEDWVSLIARIGRGMNENRTTLSVDGFLPTHGQAQDDASMGPIPSFASLAGVMDAALASRAHPLVLKPRITAYRSPDIGDMPRGYDPMFEVGEWASGKGSQAGHKTQVRPRFAWEPKPGSNNNHQAPPGSSSSSSVSSAGPNPGSGVSGGPKPMSISAVTTLSSEPPLKRRERPAPSATTSTPSTSSTTSTTSTTPSTAPPRPKSMMPAPSTTSSRPKAPVAKAAAVPKTGGSRPPKKTGMSTIMMVEDPNEIENQRLARIQARKDAAKKAKEEEKAREKARKKAAKEAERAQKKAAKEAEREAKRKAKEEERERKKKEKEEEKARKKAEREAERARKKAEKAAAKKGKKRPRSQNDDDPSSSTTTVATTTATATATATGMVGAAGTTESSAVEEEGPPAKRSKPLSVDSSAEGGAASALAALASLAHTEYS